MTMDTEGKQHWLNTGVTIWQALSIGISVILALLTALYELSRGTGALETKVQVIEAKNQDITHRQDLQSGMISALQQQMGAIQNSDAAILAKMDAIGENLRLLRDDFTMYRRTGK